MIGKVLNTNLRIVFLEDASERNVLYCGHASKKQRADLCGNTKPTLDHHLNRQGDSHDYA